MAQREPTTEDKSRPNPERPRADTPATPGSDMQPEDAGTPASGSGRGTAAEPAMKQTSKTPTESGSR